jgi:hypothetical protein
MLYDCEHVKSVTAFITCEACSLRMCLACWDGHGRDYYTSIRRACGGQAAIKESPEAIVKKVHPEAYLKKFISYGRRNEWTCLDRCGIALGPTTFSEDDAWRWAAERLEREASQK